MLKKSVRSNKILAQNIDKVWDSIKRPNLRIIEEKEIHVKGPENIFTKL